MKYLQTYWNHPFVRHVLFWIIVLLYFVLSVSNTGLFANYRHLFELYGMIVLAQMITAYTIIYILIPKFLDQKRTVLFVMWTLVLLVVVYGLYQVTKYAYFDVVYYDSYTEEQRQYAVEPLWKRFTYLPVFLSKCILYLTPAALLLMYRFYRNQQKLLQINEQKKVAELSALKNQLNPHFLFNTLNSLYVLALEKSDKTPEVIERLSDILDYILYRCNADYVSVQKEIELIENFIQLEKIRYGDRVKVHFEHAVSSDVKVAPLLLLTFIENAFKHGVSQELKKAAIAISLRSKGENLLFTVCNTKPKNSKQAKEKDSALGLQNVQKQLALLYPKHHDLEIEETADTYQVSLKLVHK